MFHKKISMALILGLALAVGGCKTGNQTSTDGKMKFQKFFCWGYPHSEETAARYASAGVTDILVANQKQYDRAVKYGMRPYWKCFTPAGPHPQVMTPEETRYCNYIGGADLDRKKPYRERMKILHQRRREKQHRYGGESVVAIDTQSSVLPCFSSDENLTYSRKKLDPILDSAPSGAAGMCLDYFGYTNHYGCYCPDCLAKYKKYLSARKLKDTPENKTAFYRDELVKYYNRIIDYIKSRRPDFKIIIHIYPDFRNDPLYGNRIKADYCGQTVSWYFKFDEAKIRKYTKFVLDHAKDHHSFAEGMPFVGVSTDKTSSLGFKTPEEVEHDLKIVLAAGGRTLMVCNGSSILEPGYFKVFKKYCGK